MKGRPLTLTIGQKTTMTDSLNSTTPIRPSEDSSASDGANGSFLTDARSVFLAWEKLRIAYVIILAFITLLLTGLSGFNLRLLGLIVQGAFVANAAYFAGPIVEVYVRWLGYKRSWPRWVMFIGGTMIASLLAVGVLAAELFPDQS